MSPIESSYYYVPFPKSKLSKEKFDVLKSFALEVYRNNGRVSDDILNDFLSIGYTKTQAVGVTANIAVKVISNLTNQLALTELDEPIVSFAGGLFQE